MKITDSVHLDLFKIYIFCSFSSICSAKFVVRERDSVLSVASLSDRVMRTFVKVQVYIGTIARTWKLPCVNGKFGCELLHEVFVMSEKVKAEVVVISPNLRFN